MTNEADSLQRQRRIADVADHALHLARQLRDVENAIGRFLGECKEFERHAAEIEIRLNGFPSLPGSSSEPKILAERWDDYDPSLRSAVIQALLICLDWRKKVRGWSSDSIRADVVSNSGEILQTVSLREEYLGPIA